MSSPAWIPETAAAVMVLAAEVSAGQLAVARAWTRPGAAAGITVSRVLMAIAMAGLLVPGLSIAPDAVWEVVFAIMTAWFGWCLWRENRSRGAAAGAGGRYAPHLVHSAAMLYLFAALAAPGTTTSGTGGMSGMAWGSNAGTPTLHAPTLALIFALLLIAFTVHDLNRQAAADGYFQVAGRPVPAGTALAAAAAGTAAPAQPTHADAAGAAAERLLLSPAVAKGCQVTIGATIAFILIILI